MVEQLECNSRGCNLHDYPVASPWCEYKWSLEQEAKADRRRADSAREVTDVLETFLEKILDLQENIGSGSGYRSSAYTNNQTEEPVMRNRGATYTWKK